MSNSDLTAQLQALLTSTIRLSQQMPQLPPLQSAIRQFVAAPQRQALAAPAPIAASRTGVTVAAAAAASASRLAPAAAAGATDGVDTQQRMQNWIAANRNPGTSRTYASGWGGFARYLQSRSISESAIRDCDVADYLRVRVTEQGMAAATVATDRAAIADHLKHTPLKSVMESPLLAQTMAVLRTMATPSKPKQHMSAELMREIILAHDARVAAAAGASPSTGWLWLRERNVFLMLLMMMAFLRESEAVALTPADVQVKQVKVAGGGGKLALHVFIRQSKTDQERRGHLVLLGGSAVEPATCPIYRYERYMASVKAHGVAAEKLFFIEGGASMKSGTPCGIVQRAVQEANASALAGGRGESVWGEPSEYGSHSMRRGGVTTARLKGASMLDIQLHGRWKSLTVFSYVGSTPAEQLAVTQGFLLAADTPAPEESGEAAAAAGRPLDAVPSDEARALRAAAATAAVAPAKSGGRKRKRTSDDEESDTEEQRREEALEENLFTEQMSQGYGDDMSGEDEPPRRRSARGKAEKEKKKTADESAGKAASKKKKQ